jgi:predicted ATP-dependent endonuclease of OLD family
MNLDGKIVAIIGSNESGKSSFLKAIQHLSLSDAFSKVGTSVELTRDIEIPPDQTIIEGVYLLNDKDREAVSHIPGGSNLRWMKIQKIHDGTFYANLTPHLTRDLSLRTEVRKHINELSHLQDLSSIPETEEGKKYEAFVKQAIQVTEALKSEEETLSEDELASIRNAIQLAIDVASAIHDQEVGENYKVLAQQLSQLLDLEEQPEPDSEARRVLFPRRPTALMFTDEARLLQSEYGLDRNSANSPPKALKNVASLAGLDLVILISAIEQGDQGKVAILEERANRRLEERMAQSWSQSGVTLRLRIDGNTVRILVGNSDTRYVYIAERSDGLRQFIALLAFVASEDADEDSILLIDEAETHLHYDAQADLVQMLAKQNVVSKVIYTTHSIGCLPEDLGTGVRLLQQSSISHSIVQNWFWESDVPGFSPLIFGLGATTLAFIPVRYAVIAEGAADVILLPSLLREGTGQRTLGFQVAPGISSSDRTEIGVLEKSGSRTAFLLDADEGGDHLYHKLRSAGIEDKRIIRVGEQTDELWTLEDFVDAEIYCSCVNTEIHRSHGTHISYLIESVPEKGRSRALHEWCKTQGIDPPSKRAVAYRLLEQAHEGKTLLSPRGLSAIQKLYPRILAALDIPA